MTLKVFWFRALLLLCCGALMSGCATDGVRPLSVEQARYDFGQTLAVVQKNYVDEVAVDPLVDAAIAGMYRYTGVTPPEEKRFVTSNIESRDDPLYRFAQVYQQLMHRQPPQLVVESPVVPQPAEPAGNHQVGIGVTLALDGEWIRVAVVRQESAAEAAGINRGDAIIAINGLATAGHTLTWCYQQLNGVAGSVVEVSVNTEDGEVIDYRVVRSPVYVPNIVMLVPEQSHGPSPLLQEGGA